jgi:hypothetical protein
LSGRLAAAVGGHPPFPGDEAAYARARIALVTAGTALAPAGALAVGAAGGAPAPADGWDGADDLARVECVFGRSRAGAARGSSNLAQPPLPPSPRPPASSSPANRPKNGR